MLEHLRRLRILSLGRLLQYGEASGSTGSAGDGQAGELAARKLTAELSGRGAVFRGCRRSASSRTPALRLKAVGLPSHAQTHYFGCAALGFRA